jgi:hypothetical protein
LTVILKQKQWIILKIQTAVAIIAPAVMVVAVVTAAAVVKICVCKNEKPFGTRMAFCLN